MSYAPVPDSSLPGTDGRAGALQHVVTKRSEQLSSVPLFKDIL
jgi:hypothetical protein